MHIFLMFSGGAASWLSSMSLRGLTQRHPQGDALLQARGGDALFELWAQLSPGATVAAWWLLAAGIIVLLLSPALFLSWAHALHGRAAMPSARSLVVAGLRGYPRVAMISLCVLPLSALGLLGIWLSIRTGYSAAPPPIPDSIACLALITGLGCLIVAGLLHDLGRSRLVRRVSTAKAIKESCLLLLNRSLWLRFLGYRTASMSLLALALYAAADARSSELMSSLFSTLLPHALLLGRTCLRSWWLATLVGDEPEERPETDSRPDTILSEVAEGIEAASV
jgi:hypothetical protein